MICFVASSFPNKSVRRVTSLACSFCLIDVKLVFKELISHFLESPATVVPGLILIGEVGALNFGLSKSKFGFREILSV